MPRTSDKIRFLEVLLSSPLAISSMVSMMSFITRSAARLSSKGDAGPTPPYLQVPSLVMAALLLLDDESAT